MTALAARALLDGDLGAVFGGILEAGDLFVEHGAEALQDFEAGGAEVAADLIRRAELFGELGDDGADAAATAIAS